MNKIYLSFPSGDLTEYDPEELSVMFEQGLIQDECFYWRQGMAEWLPIGEYFKSSEIELSELPQDFNLVYPPPPYMTEEQKRLQAHSGDKNYFIVIVILLVIIVAFLITRNEKRFFYFKNEMVQINPQPFWMGSPLDEIGRKMEKSNTR